uniref:hypothetical protein n=1 Tax=Cupriavidus yeoncheonensis TaxID=1462994 RepID=UPI003F493DAC
MRPLSGAAAALCNMLLSEQLIPLLLDSTVMAICMADLQVFALAMFMATQRGRLAAASP